MMDIPHWTKYFLPLSRVITACAALFACKPGGETLGAVVSWVPFDASSDLRALLVNEPHNCLYVADHNKKQIHCIDLTTHSINQAAALNTTGEPVAMAMTRDATTLVVATENASTGSAVEIFIIGKPSSSSCALPGTPTSVAVTGQNHIYAGVSNEQGSIYSCGTVAAPTPNAASKLTGYSRIAGISNKGLILFAVSNDMSLATLWDTQVESPSTIMDTVFGEFFTSNSNYGWIVFHPEDNEAYVLTNGTATQVNFLPAYSVEYSPPKITLTTSPLQPAFVPNALAFLESLPRVVMTHASAAPLWAPDQHAQADLHVFDTGTGEELGRYDLGGHARENSLAVDQRNAIYVLLGEKQATSVGIVRAP